MLLVVFWSRSFFPEINLIFRKTFSVQLFDAQMILNATKYSRNSFTFSEPFFFSSFIYISAIWICSMYSYQILRKQKICGKQSYRMTFVVVVIKSIALHILFIFRIFTFKLSLHWDERWNINKIFFFLLFHFWFFAFDSEMINNRKTEQIDLSKEEFSAMA